MPRALWIAFLSLFVWPASAGRQRDHRHHRRLRHDRRHSAKSLVGPLFSGPLDIVGDVHGEIGALVALLDLLGYDGDGVHPEGRRLVFLGDLGDRGPNSVAVVRLVRRLVSKRRAQAIVGNHELNVLLGERKHGNAWWGGESEVTRKDKKALSFQTPADERFRASALGFFKRLPLALERPASGSDAALAVVHAAWIEPSVAKLRNVTFGPGGVAKAFAKFDRKIKKRGARRRASLLAHEAEMMAQNANPVRVLTSGLEQLAPKPFFAGGRMRRLARKHWWENHTAPAEGAAGPSLVVIGHYWRRWMGEVDARAPKGFAPSGADVFDGYAPTALLGPARRVMCVDYAVGIRFEERGLRLPAGSLGSHLAALRLPERTIHLEDGRVLPVT